MRKIPLRSIPSKEVGLTPEQAEADRLDYIATIQQVVRRVSLNPDGATIEEMEQGLRILKALAGKKLGDYLYLEDADHAHLCQKVRVSRWSVVDERIVEFARAVINAEEIEEYRDEPDSPTPVGVSNPGSFAPPGRVERNPDRLRLGRESSAVEADIDTTVVRA